jgi:gamma-glutamylcyclotransferase (GGCT)/AIG2-like uncharacterized protein YtfP
MTSQGVYHLFVYGSLRSGFRSQAYEYISRFFTLVGDARVKGILFDLGTYPAGVKTNEEKYIIGELYRIRDEGEFSWAFGQLDDYEGVNEEGSETPLYRREITEAHIDNKIIPAWIYWFNGDTSGKPVIESGDLLHYLRAGK